LDIHAEKTGVEIDGPIHVTHGQHGMSNMERDTIDCVVWKHSVSLTSC
jgi:hypothetical protein